MAPTRTAVAGEAPAGVAAGAPAGDQVPVLAQGVQLLGAVDASGFEEPPCLARRADGQTIQLTDLLYRVLESIDGRRDAEAIAAEVSRRIDKRASAEDIQFLVEEKLRPLGLLRRPDGREPEVRKADPLLGLRFRWVLADEATTRRVTAPFAQLFRPPIVVVVVAGFAAMVGWLLFAEGVGAGARQALYSPGFLLLVFGLAAASAGFHEFGHAAALRYGGGTPGAMGAGLYLVWPAFYTDVTDSYRLPRRARLRTDLGGLYFNMVFALGVFAVWAATGADALLLVVPLLLLQMVQQLLPFVRLDGYHILADLTGVPDLFARIRPTLASLRPGREPDRRVTALKSWVRVVVTLWVVAVIPLLLASLAFAVVSLPRVSATAWDSLGLQRQAVAGAWGDGDVPALVAGVLSVLALALPVLSTAYLLGRVGSRGGRAAWRATDGRPVVRGALASTGVALAVVSAFVLWPNGEYRPYQPGERARVSETVAAVRHVRTGRPSLLPARAERLDGAPFRSGVAAGEAEAPVDATPTTVPSTTTTPTSTATATAGDTVATTTTTDATSSTTDAPATTSTTSDTTTTTTTTTTTSTETTAP
jgi:putative peptide zinc metalloprotease protein